MMAHPGRKTLNDEWLNCLTVAIVWPFASAIRGPKKIAKDMVAGVLAMNTPDLDGQIGDCRLCACILAFRTVQ
jgi:hypothetical protein